MAYAGREWHSSRMWNSGDDARSETHFEEAARPSAGLGVCLWTALRVGSCHRRLQRRDWVYQVTACFSLLLRRGRTVRFAALSDGFLSARAVCSCESQWRNGGGQVDSGRDAEVTSGLLAFAEQTTDFVGVSDPWGRILYLNPAAQKRLGVVDGTDLTIADLFPSEAFTFYYEVVRPQLLRTGAWTGEVLVNAAGSDATPMYVSTIARLGPGGEVNGGVVYAHELPGTDLSIVPPSDVDETTGLLSRSAFDDQAGRALAVGRREVRDAYSCLPRSATRATWSTRLELSRPRT